MTTREIFMVVIIPLITTFVFNKVFKSQKLPISTDYVVRLDSDSMRVLDPDTDVVIYAESYESGSPLVEAIFNDNK